MITSINEIPRKKLMMAILAMLALILLQMWLLRSVRILNSEVNASDHEANSLEKVLKTRSDTVMKYKNALRFNRDLLPVPADTATDFYVALVSMISSTPLQDALITKISEKPDMVVFNLKGEADYFWLLNTLASLRQTSYMMRLSEITAEALSDGAVKYSFTVETSLKVPEATETKGSGGGAK